MNAPSRKERFLASIPQASIEAALDGALGDVARISYGTTKDNRNTSIASYSFD